jgi:hypothetical protein
MNEEQYQEFDSLDRSRRIDFKNVIEKNINLRVNFI